jgi:hypothetical protein
MAFPRLAALVVAWLLVGCTTAPLIEPSAAPSGAVPATAEPPRPTPTPVGSVIQVGPLDADSVPSSVEGVAVLRGQDLRTTVDASRDAKEMLAGGWFHGPPGGSYCSLQPADWDPAVSMCNAIALFEHRVGGTPILRISSGDIRDAATLSSAVDRPVVLRVHTHDPRCPAEDQSCDRRAVALGIAWLGDAPLESAPPRVVGTPPPGGISRADAIELARDESMPHRTPLTLRSAVAAPIWAVLPSEETSRGDIWVWKVVFEADFDSPCDDCQSSNTEEVFLEYLTGAFIMARW